jgi:glycosyltransferase involved in cell wall biosynthesis
MDAALRIVLIEPFCGGSHQAWAQGYAAHSAHEVELLGLPAAHWKWRMQGAHVTLAPRIERMVEASGLFDVALASSTTNLPALLGLARGSLGGTRAVLYMHENQLTYPISQDGREDLTYAMVNWTSMVAADLVVFNSEFHRRAWFDALPGFLGRFPDQRHAALIDEVADRCAVLPVGCDLRPLDAVDRAPADRPLILWNQRWEHDKGPDRFAAAIRTLVDDGLEFAVALAGERPGEAPAELAAIRAVLGDRLVHDGFADRDVYRRLLRRANVVVSAADHEFFGIALTEAIYAGAFPVLPNRLVYPERLPAEFHDVCLYDGQDQLVDRLRWAIIHRADAAAVAARLKPVMAGFDWSVVAPRYDETFRPLGV